MDEETLFNEALALPPEERAAYLESACGGDEELRRKIEGLLEAHGEARESFLVGEAPDFGDTLPASPRIPPESPAPRGRNALGAAKRPAPTMIRPVSAPRRTRPADE